MAKIKKVRTLEEEYNHKRYSRYQNIEDAGEKHYLTCVAGIECKYPKTN